MNYNIAGYDFEVKDDAFSMYVPYKAEGLSTLYFNTHPYRDYSFWILEKHKEESFAEILLYLGLPPYSYAEKFQDILFNHPIEKILKLLMRVCSPLKVSTQHLEIGRATMASFPLVITEILPELLNRASVYGEIDGYNQRIVCSKLLSYWKTGELA